MLSICIPVYNWDVNKLCQSLSKEANKLDLPVEILALDDGSSKHFHKINESIAEIDLVDYQRLEQNVGRSKIRNILFANAQYEYCLFLDNDSAIPDIGFLRSFMEQAKPGSILYGGTTYPNNCEKPFQLHCRYGREREARPVHIRKQAPFKHFKSNNFLLCKSDFATAPFDERISKYGYEDNEFAEKVKKKGLEIHHLANPVIHLGLMNNKHFLQRQLDAIDNLYFLKSNGSTIESALWDSYQKLSRSVFKLPIRASLVLLAYPMKWILLNRQSPLIFLDLLKLRRILSISASET